MRRHSLFLVPETAARMLSAAAIAAWLLSPVQAATPYFIGGGNLLTNPSASGYDFSEGTDWSTGNTPGPNDTAVISSTASGGITAAISTSSPYYPGSDLNLNSLYIGADGTIQSAGSGSLNQDSGFLSTTAGLTLGSLSGTTGSYSLTSTNASMLDSGGLTVIGGAGTGNVSINSGAYLNETGVNGAIVLGRYSGGSGTATISGSSQLASSISSGSIIVGNAGTGGLTMTSAPGAPNVQAHAIYVGGAAGGSGTFTENAGLVLTTGGTLQIGSSSGLDNSTAGTGTFNLNGGTVSTGSVYVGNSGGNGTLNISSPAGSALTAQNEFVVGNGTGSMGAVSVGSSSVNLNQTVYVGQNGGTGTFGQTAGTVTYGSTVSGGQGNNGIIIGNGGTGTYTISGGTLQDGSSAGNWNLIGSQNGGNGNLDVNGGTVNFSGRVVVGDGGGSSGTVTQTAGTVNATAGEALTVIGDANGATGTYSISGGSFNGVNVQVGQRDGGQGNLNVSGSGQFNASGTLSVGSLNDNNSPTTTGTVTQTGGTISTPNFNVGDGGGGFATQGTYNLQGGLLSVNGTTLVGNNSASTGIVTQSGGTADTGNLVIGNGAGSTGTYNISAGLLDATKATDTNNYGIVVGNAGNGALAQTGGTVNAEYLNIANNASGTGVFSESGTGVINVNQGTIVGNGGFGTLNVSGGTVNLSTAPQVASPASDTSPSYVGASSFGIVNQTGGTVTVGNGTVGDSNGWLNVGQNNVGGTYNISGGTLSDSSGRIQVGNPGQNGAVLNISQASNAVPTVVNTGGGNLELFGGNLNISGGTLNNPGADYQNAWNGTAATYQTGGTVQTNSVSLALNYSTSATAGAYTLAGGVLSTNQVSLGSQSGLLGTAATPTITNGSGQTNTFGAYGALTFNGGTLQAAGNAGNLLDGGITAVLVDKGGAVLDSAGYAATINHSLDSIQAVNASSGGQSVTGITLTETLSGYLSAPAVVFSGGGGIGATGYAVLNGSGQVTGIVLTSPGAGYTSAPTITVQGGGQGSVSLSSSDVTLGSYNSTGGLTIVDSSGTNKGVITLTTNNSYTGPTNINGGTLSVGGGPQGGANDRGFLPVGTVINVNSGGTLQSTVTDSLGYGAGAPSQLNVNEGGTVTVTGGVRDTLWLSGGGAVTLAGGTLASAAGNGDGNGNYSVISQINATSAADGTPSMITANQIALQSNSLGNGPNIIDVTRGSGLYDLGITSNITDLNASAGLTFNGNGYTVLSGTNTFSGGLTINGGAVVSMSSGGNTSLGTGNVAVNAGAYLVGGAGDSFGYGGNAPQTIDINGGTVTNLPGSYRVTLPSLTFSGGGTLLANAGNTTGDGYGAYSFFGNGNETINVTNPGTTTALITGGNIGLQSPTTFNVTRGTATSDLTVSSNLTPFNGSTNGVTITGNGITTFSGANTYTGTTTVDGGLLNVTGSLANNSSSSVLVQSGGASFGGAGNSSGGEIDRAVAAGGTYAGFGSQATGAGTNGTQADILAGTANNGAGSVDMSWRNIASNESVGNTAGPPPSFDLTSVGSNVQFVGLISDVLNLHGMATTGGAGTATDPFALSLTYNPALVPNSPLVSLASIHLDWLNPATGFWEHAVSGNIGVGADAVRGFQGTFANFEAHEDSLLGPNYVQNNLGLFLGSSGVGGGTAWAVLDHNSSFAVAVPEPSTLVLGGLGLMALVGCRRWQRRRSA